MGVFCGKFKIGLGRNVQYIREGINASSCRSQ